MKLPFKLFKRTSIKKWQAYLLRVIAVICSLILSILLFTIIIGKSPLDIVSTMIKGATVDIWYLLLNTSLLLGFGIAIIPSFKMKYWNMGANGQVLMGATISGMVLFYLSDSVVNSSNPALSNILLILLLLVISIAVSTIWAVIPALFKAFFNTNETLFTLMTNYIAIAFTSFAVFLLSPKDGSPGIINQNRMIECFGETISIGWLPTVINRYFIPIIVVIVMAVFVYFYMSKTKHGFEVIVMGDSEKTAKYVGMHTKTIVIRTLILNGVLCGILGFLYVTAINHSISTSTGGQGFVAILIAWLANFNPLIMALISLFLTFLSLGTSKVSAIYRIGNDQLSNVIIGIVFFSILVSEFFIRFKISFNTKKEEIK